MVVFGPWNTFLIEEYIKRVLKRSYWITEAHLIIICLKYKKNWLHKGLIKLSWVRLHFSPPCLPCSYGGQGGDYCGMERECIDFVIFIPWLHLGMSRQYHWGTGSAPRRRKQQFFLSSQCVLSVLHRGKPVRFLTWGVFICRWLSDLKTNKPPCLKVSIIRSNGNIWMLSTPIREQLSLTAV